MNCNDARAAMLVAEPRDLNADGGSPLATHLHDCPECAERARILGANLEGLRRRVGTRASQRTRGVLLIAAIPVAAAVIVAVALDRRVPAVPAAPIAHDVPRAEKMVSVDVARGQQATVLKTKDPKVTVVWLTPGGGL